MVNNMECRVCGTTTEKYSSFNNIARQVSVLKKEPFEYKGQNVDMFVCSFCNHYQIEYNNEENYYDDYIMLPSAESITPFRQRQIEKLYKINPNVKSFIEIGCGDGGFLEHASKHYTRVVGNEPSRVYNQLTKNRGYECTEDYITKDLKITEYYSGPAAKAYMEVDRFSTENISVNYWDYSNYPIYSQIHGEFEHGVSVIDLIMNEGNNSINFLK